MGRIEVEEMEWVMPKEGNKVKVGPLAGDGVEGEVFYMLTGPEDGPVAVCINGIGGWCCAWEEVEKQMTELGYRVLRYDHFNRGFSSTVTNCSFDTDHYLETLDDLLGKLGLSSQPLTVMGHSMGGALALGYASKHLDKLERLVLFNPAGFFPKPKIISAIRAGRAIGLHSLAVRIANNGTEQAIKDDFFVHGDAYKRALSSVRPMAKNCPKAGDALILSALNTHLLFNATQPAQHIADSATNLPVLVVLGQHDKTCPTNHTRAGLEQVFQNKSNIKFVLEEVAQTRHVPMLEKADDVHQILTRFLQTQATE